MIFKMKYALHMLRMIITQTYQATYSKSQHYFHSSAAQCSRGRRFQSWIAVKTEIKHPFSQHNTLEALQFTDNSVGYNKNN